MTLPEFIAKYDNQYVNFDQIYGPQCMDLYRMYVQEVLGFPQSQGVRGAADVWTKYLVSHYDRVAKVEGNYPLLGDIVIWSRRYGPAGHIAIVEDADVDGMICFSQNDPAKEPAKLKEYRTYKHVMGWLHPKMGIE